MLVRPVPFVDELVHGFRGRVMRRNGVSTAKELDVLMREWAGVAGSDWRDVPVAILLSKIAGMSVHEFVRHHTMAPFSRAITWFHPEILHGCESNLRLLWATPMRLARDGAYFCEHCVAEDLEFRGESYWHRIHQIPGVFWCHEHRVPLHYLEKDSAFQKPPSVLMDDARRVSQNWIEGLIKNPYLLRYADISSSFLERGLPFNVVVVSHVLKGKARALGFQTCGSPVKRPLLSDLAINEVGRPWLATVIPAMANKAEGEISHQFDGACYLKKSSSTVAVYGLVCALLYSSADEAINALTGKCIDDIGPRRKRRIDIPEGDLIDAYIQARGDHGQAAKQFDCVYQTVSSRYAALGLPNFAGKRGARLFETALAFYVEEKSWLESIAVGGITPCEMEILVRSSKVGIGKILREIRFPSGSVSVSSRPRRLNPGAVQEMTEAMAQRAMASESEKD